MRSVCLDCASLEAPTAVTINLIARLHLAMRRCGYELELANPNHFLVELICFAGLAEVLGGELERQAEQREEPGGVEEERELGDPSVF